MLIIIPPSETKRPAPESGPAIDLHRLSFPELTAVRGRVMDALIATSQRPDALRRLRVGPSLAGEVARNENLRELPTRRAVETYAGPLYQGLDAASWSAGAHSRASQQLIIVSALWGALRPGDLIPPYRLHVCARLDGMDRLEPTWRTVLPGVLTDAARQGGPVLDLRSPAYQAVGRAAGLADEAVTLRVRPSPGGPAHVGDVTAKRVRGEAARHLLTAEADPEDPLELAQLLAERWPLELDAPAGRNQAWKITLLTAT